MLPSIWIGSFDDHASWERAADRRAAWEQVAAEIDDRIMSSRHPRMHRAWCVVCGSVQPMRVGWNWGGIADEGVAAPLWTETARCQGCQLNSRQRALLTLLRTFPGRRDHQPCFAAEQITPAFSHLQRHFRTVIGSEYVGPEVQPGASAALGGHTVRHEDITRLSLADRSVGTVITQDVLEHVPDFRAGLRDIRRVLRRGGRTVFTVPMDARLACTRSRAVIDDNGSVQHLVEPWWHGNPLGGGSLCFHDFGWDLLDHLRSAGFRRATAHAYWGPWAGHLGGPSFIIEAVR